MLTVLFVISVGLFAYEVAMTPLDTCPCGCHRTTVIVIEEEKATVLRNFVPDDNSGDVLCHQDVADDANCQNAREFLTQLTESTSYDELEEMLRTSGFKKCARSADNSDIGGPKTNQLGCFGKSHESQFWNWPSFWFACICGVLNVLCLKE